MDRKQRYEIGYKLGVEAFEAGKKSVPALDARLRSILTGTGKEILATLKGWSDGWHTSNVRNAS